MRSYLIVGNQTLAGPDLTAAITERVGSTDPPQFYVVVPATPVGGGFTWDEDEAHAAAQERLDAMLAHLRDLGVEASGEVGARDPVEAARDAIRRHPVDEVILSTLPAGISRWLGQDAPTRLRAAIPVPVVVVTAQPSAVEAQRH
jgi:nucleotide-binding universal stress UspA family protein